jgi:hypothetical protein
MDLAPPKIISLYGKLEFNMKKQIIFIALITVFVGSSALFAQWGKDVKDTYETIPDNEYYVTVFYADGNTQQITLPSCAEAISLKDRLLHSDNKISYITIRAKFRVHMWHDDCNGQQFRP